MTKTNCTLTSPSRPYSTISNHNADVFKLVYKHNLCTIRVNNQACLSAPTPSNLREHIHHSALRRKSLRTKPLERRNCPQLSEVVRIKSPLTMTDISFSNSSCSWTSDRRKYIELWNSPLPFLSLHLCNIRNSPAGPLTISFDQSCNGLKY